MGVSLRQKNIHNQLNLKFIVSLIRENQISNYPMKRIFKSQLKKYLYLVFGEFLFLFYSEDSEWQGSNPRLF